MVVHVMCILCFHFSSFPLFYQFGSFFPVYSQDKIFVVLRSINFQQSMCFFCVVSREEKPSAARSFSGVAQIVVNRWCFQLKIDSHSTRFRINFNKRQCSTERSEERRVGK